MSITLRELMERSVTYLRKIPLLHTCSRDTSLRSTLDILKRSGGGSVIITQDKRPIGIFTERDYLIKIAGNGIDLDKETVGDYMTENPYTINESESIYNAIITMQIGQFRHLIIVDEKGYLDKVLSIRDLMDYFLLEVIHKILPEDKPRKTTVKRSA